MDHFNHPCRNILIRYFIFVLLLMFGNVILGAEPVSKEGLLGEYYSGYFGDNFHFFDNKIPVLSRIDEVVNFPAVPWNLEETPISNRELFSVRWSGFINIPTTGSYTFFTYSDDASFVFLMMLLLIPLLIMQQ